MKMKQLVTMCGLLGLGWMAASTATATSPSPYETFYLDETYTAPGGAIPREEMFPGEVDESGIMVRVEGVLFFEDGLNSDSIKSSPMVKRMIHKIVHDLCDVNAEIENMELVAEDGYVRAQWGETISLGAGGEIYTVPAYDMTITYGFFGEAELRKVDCWERVY